MNCVQQRGNGSETALKLPLMSSETVSELKVQSVWKKKQF